VLQDRLLETKTNTHLNTRSKLVALKTKDSFFIGDCLLFFLCNCCTSTNSTQKRREAMKNSIELVKQYQSYLIGCASCNMIWFGKNPPIELFWEISFALLELNEQRLSTDVLFANDIFLSHGFCPECLDHSSLGESIRARQIREGNFPCFGSARHGHCDQANCKYRSLCIWDMAVNPQEMTYYSRLCEMIATNQPPAHTLLRV
jgi:hypothetical protein